MDAIQRIVEARDALHLRSEPISGQLKDRIHDAVQLAEDDNPTSEQASKLVVTGSNV